MRSKDWLQMHGVIKQICPIGPAVHSVPLNHSKANKSGSQELGDALCILYRSPWNNLGLTAKGTYYASSALDGLCEPIGSFQICVLICD